MSGTRYGFYWRKARDERTRGSRIVTIAPDRKNLAVEVKTGEAKSVTDCRFDLSSQGSQQITNGKPHGGKIFLVHGRAPEPRDLSRQCRLGSTRRLRIRTLWKPGCVSVKRLRAVGRLKMNASLETLLRQPTTTAAASKVLTPGTDNSAVAETGNVGMPIRGW